MYVVVVPPVVYPGLTPMSPYTHTGYICVTMFDGLGDKYPNIP